MHPGEILADKLEAIGVTPTELARQIRAPPNRLSEIIRGRRGVSGDTALRLGHRFGASPQFWINLQTAYDLRTAAEQAGPAIEALPRRGDRLEPALDAGRVEAPIAHIRGLKETVRFAEGFEPTEPVGEVWDAQES